jgi:hypothetical protein
MMIIELRFGLLSFALLSAATACAESSRTEWHLGANYLDWNGPSSGVALPTGTPGFGVELEASRGGRVFELLARLQADYSQSGAPFYDSTGIKPDLSFRYFGVLAGLGAKINVIPASQFTVYLSGLATAGISTLSLPASSSYQSLSTFSLAPAGGYQVQAGLEVGSLFIEAGHRILRADLQGQSPYGLDAWLLTGGLSW